MFNNELWINILYIKYHLILYIIREEQGDYTYINYFLVIFNIKKSTFPKFVLFKTSSKNNFKSILSFITHLYKKLKYILKMLQVRNQFDANLRW